MDLNLFDLHGPKEESLQFFEILDVQIPDFLFISCCKSETHSA
jgi:hypothetical protein